MVWSVRRIAFPARAFVNDRNDAGWGLWLPSTISPGLRPQDTLPGLPRDLGVVAFVERPGRGNTKGWALKYLLLGAFP